VTQLASPRRLITEGQFLQELRDFVAADPGSQAAEMAARLEMELASPGAWDAAKHEASPVEESPETTE